MDARSWLAALVGDWQLTGSMSSVELRQEVTARWALGSRFVRIDCLSTLPAEDGSLYEATYFIGHNETEDVLVMHLLDSLGVATDCPVGVGRLEGSSVEFVFDYASGPFVNRFSYSSSDDSWRHDLFSLGSGSAETFATKHLQRRRADWGGEG